MRYKLKEQGLFYLNNESWQWVGGWIKVVARTRLPDKRRGHGVLLAWKNFDNELLSEAVYARVLNSDHAREVREMLVDTGYPLEPGSASWGRLQRYLLQEMATAEPATVVNRTGWHEGVFATPGWTLGAAGEPHHFVGQLSGRGLLQESGCLAGWQENVGALCCGNPMAIFSVGVALAAPLLHTTGMENGAFHLVGTSSTGKSTLLQVATSVYGDKTFSRSWVSTSNGLAAVSAEHHDMLLPLDEIGAARPEDVSAAIYQVMNGAGKLRASISGALQQPVQWRTLVLSTGEVWLSELMEQLGQPMKAGQQIRLVEIPIFGTHGAFENIHGRAGPRAFVEELQEKCTLYHGALFRKWIELLTEGKAADSTLAISLGGELRLMVERWTTEHMASQVQRVVARFALLAVALALASRNALLPWSEVESVQAVHQVLRAWLDTRGHTFNAEEFRLLTELGRLLQHSDHRIADDVNSFDQTHLAFKRDVAGEPQWVWPRQRFLQHFGLPTRYMRELEPLLQRGLLETNERSRGTLRLQIDGRNQRFFAIWPERVRQYLKTVAAANESSQFPSCPTADLGVQGHE